MDEAEAQVRLGGVTIARAEALTHARSYLSGVGGYGYPAYDAFDAGGGPWRLSDGDLLAPALLNVRVRVRAFYALVDARGQLETWLRRVPLDARLAEAGTRELELLADLFAVIDAGLPGVRGTTLAKIMHRKRPAFVPLYDRYVWRCYVGVPDAPIPRDRNRTWSSFMLLLASAMRTDLIEESAWLTKISALAQDPVPVSPLRALDIVVWQAGKRQHVADEPDDIDEEPDPSHA